MPEQSIETNSGIETILDRIAMLHVNDVARSQPEHVERLGKADKMLALPLCLVLSSAALRGEGISVPQGVEKRVATALGVVQGDWKNAVTDTYLMLGSEATTGRGSEYMMVALGDEALETVKNQQPVGYQTLREMVKLAVAQEQALENQADIVYHNIAVESQQ